MTTLFHSGTPDDVLILALRDHSDPAVTELLARYTPFVGVDICDVVMRDDHEEKLAKKDEEWSKKVLECDREIERLQVKRDWEISVKLGKYKAALVYARSELATMSEMLGNLSDKIAGELNETV